MHDSDCVGIMIFDSLLLIGIAKSAAVVLLLRDWRRTFPSLLINYVLLSVFLARQEFLTPDFELPGFQVSTLVVVKLITGIAVTAMLTLTAMTFSREYGLEDFALAMI